MSIPAILIFSLFLGLIVGAGIDSSHILPVTVISTIVLFINRKKITATGDSTRSDSQLQLDSDKYYAWPASGQFIPVTTGTLHQQDAIRQLIQENAINPEKNAEPRICTLKAHLIPETDNLRYTNAIRVDIHNRTVGYLDSEQIPVFLDILNKKNLSEQITTCNAIIARHGKPEDKTFHYRVELDLEPLVIDQSSKPECN